jgi:hypothetical protein
MTWRWIAGTIAWCAVLGALLADLGGELPRPHWHWHRRHR